MRFRYTVEVEVEREQGKFASRDEISEEIKDAIEGSDPGSISGVGSDGDSEYSVIQWDVTEEDPA